MASYLLDTSVIIDALNGKRGRVTLLRNLLLTGNLLCCCAINVTEVYAGMKAKERQQTELFLNSLDYYNVTREIATQAGLLKCTWAERGVTLSVSDVTVAAVAIEHGLLLLTDNVKHYPMPEVTMHPLPPD
ncbi:MAG: PIN domain-containing protein [Candidatus Melainabacteria bacterium]|nr:PIN domain-containing protein [Candidatus Melainabacteria bacterium]